MKNTKKTSFFKKLALGFGILVIALISLIFAAPTLFKGKILAIAKREINNHIQAKADFKDVDISFLRKFPKVDVQLQKFRIVGVDEFENDTLISADFIGFSVDIMSFLSGSEYKIHSVAFEKPRIRAIVNEQGKANWAIVSSDTTQKSSEAEPYALQLQQYSIRNGYIVFEDLPGGIKTKVDGLDHSGSGDFSADNFTIKTSTKASSVFFEYGGITYLNHVNSQADLSLQVDAITNTYSFRNAEIALNKFIVGAEGYVRMIGDTAYDMDIDFSSPSSNLKDLISLVPAFYTSEFDKIQVSGVTEFSGTVKGKYSEQEMPGYDVHLKVQKGMVKYPDLPKSLKNISVEAALTNVDGQPDHTIVDVKQAHIEFGDVPVDFRILAKNMISNPFIDFTLQGKIDLNSISQMVKLESGTKLSGLVQAAVAAKGHVAAMQEQRLNQFHTEGTVDVKNFSYLSKDYPDGVKMEDLQLAFTPAALVVKNAKGEYLKTNFSAAGRVDNLLAYLLKDEPMTGDLRVKADKVNLNDWMGVDSDTASSTASEPFRVPGKLNVTVQTSVDHLIYDGLTMSDLKGLLQIKDETVLFRDVQASALDGTMKVDGSYSTRHDKAKPDISLSYDLKEIDAQKAFYAFNTYQKLMPIGKYISGKLSSRMDVKGKLGADMFPDLNSLSGQGNLLLIQGFLSKFAPVDRLAEMLNVAALREVSLKDIKNYVEFDQGKVRVKPFKIKKDDIEMQIQGDHGFDQAMNYVVQLKLPRHMMGEKGNQYVNNLVNQINARGVPVKVADVVNLKINVGGSITKPVFQTDLKEAGQTLTADVKTQVTQFVQHKVDSTKKAVTATVRDTLSSVKQQVTEAAKHEIGKRLLQTADSTQSPDLKKSLEQSGKGIIQNINPFKKKKKDR